MNYAMKDKNPVDKVRFYTKYELSESVTIPKEQVSLLIPEQFSEHYIRIFVKNPEKIHEAQKVFRKFLDAHNFKPSPAHSLPPNKLKSLGGINSPVAKKLFQD